jgi:uncharacterized protein YidB (DUF937 family)
MEKRSPWFWVLLAAGGVVVGYLYYLRQKAAQLASSDISSPIARGARYGAGLTDSVVSKIPWIGKYLVAGGKPVFEAPLTNVTSGNVGDTVESIASGGVTDVTSSWLGWP